LNPAAGSSLSCSIAYINRRCTGFNPSRTSGSDREVMVESA
jgi:hypothetical protein